MRDAEHRPGRSNNAPALVLSQIGENGDLDRPSVGLPMLRMDKPGTARCQSYVARINPSETSKRGRQIHMTVLAVVVGVLFPLMTILATLRWAWRNGTLRETAQKRYDRHFEQIVRRI